MVKYSKAPNTEFIDLGEEQFDYDISRTLDETLDSCKVVVNSSIEDALHPGTFILLDNEYWYLENDKSESNVDGTFTHTLELVELTQILNDIFIQDCTFYQNRYTYTEGLYRLFTINELSSKRIIFDNLDSVLNTTQKFPYFRFEGYSLFNALREIFQSLDRFPRVIMENGYLVVTFDTLDGKDRETINLDQLQSDGKITMESFKERGREKNSNQVISNITNVGGNVPTTFPSTRFGVPLAPKNYAGVVEKGNACIELPEKALQVLDVTCYPEITIEYRSTLAQANADKTYTGVYSNNFNKEMENFIEEIKQITPNIVSYYNIDTKLNEFFRDNPPKFVIEDGKKTTKGSMALLEKKKYDLLSKQYVFDNIIFDSSERTLYWTQFDNKIENFSFSVQFLSVNGQILLPPPPGQSASTYPKINILYDYAPRKARYSATYYPCSNLKLSYENNNYDEKIINNTKKYNQTGKIIDLSATLNSVKNYIIKMQEEDTVLNAYYFNKNDILPIGCNVIYGGKKYVVTNVSITKHNNDNYSARYQLNENVVRRSEFISADSDILNYDIPINDTIDRHVLYKDTLRFYVDSRKGILGTKKGFKGLTAFNVFKDFGEIDDGTSTFYIKYIYNNSGNIYERERYYLRPSNIFFDNNAGTIIFSCKMKDNSLIGWNSKLQYSEFNVLSTTDYPATPIRYTDGKGEIKSVEIRLGGEPTQEVMEYYPSLEYTDSEGRHILYPTKYNGTITDTNLLKDAYEVLNFEYMIEYKDSEDIKLNKTAFISNNFVRGNLYNIDLSVCLFDNDCPINIDNTYNKIPITNVEKTYSSFEFTLQNEINIENKYIGLYDGNQLVLQINKNVIEQTNISVLTLYCNCYSIKA